MSYCEHVYRDVGEITCPYCGEDTNRYDWAKVHREHQEWKEKNPHHEVVWWSI